MELPSLTKKMVLNINMIAGILLLTLAIVVVLWQLVPLYIEEVVIEADDLAIEFEYWREVQPGQEWLVNVTASYAGASHVKDIEVIIVSDEYVSGGEAFFDIVMGGRSKSATIRGKIKDSAPWGEHEVMTVATASKANVSTKNLDILVIEPGVSQ